jgi:hypothetical protein
MTSTHRRGAVRIFFARIWSHLTRSTARWAYLIAALCLLVYATVPLDWPAADPIRQVALILTSVAIGGALLPELPTNLWSIDAARVRALVPDHQRAHLAQALIEAESDDPRWNQLVWTHALRPVLAASREPWQYVWDMDYTAAVHLSRSFRVGERERILDAVSVQQKSLRVLSRPGVSRVWVTMARNAEALRDEFTAAGCLGRELVEIGDDVTGTDWQDAVLELCRVSMSIDGEAIELQPEAVPERPGVVRWYTPADYRIPESRVRLRLAYEFVSEPGVREFGVFFSSYYTAGTTDVTLRLHDEHAPSTVETEYFVAHALDVETRPTVVTTSSTVVTQVSVSTGKDSLLWPGSGVIFRWEPRS